MKYKKEVKEKALIAVLLISNFLEIRNIRYRQNYHL